MRNRDIDALFYELVKEAEKTIHRYLSEYSKLYILNLLKKLSMDNEIFNNKIVNEKAIAEIFMEAFHKNIFERIRYLKLSGDISLLTAGLYPESINKKIVDIDYYMQMGRSSYRELSTVYSQYRSKTDLSTLYWKLKEEFYTLVEILTEIADELNFINRSNISHIQRRFEKTDINKYREILSEQKIIPLSKHINERGED